MLGDLVGSIKNAPNDLYSNPKYLAGYGKENIWCTLMSVIIDSGPLVALLSERDHFHEWASEKARTIKTPWHTCEAVLSQAFFLLSAFARVKLCQALRKSELFVID